MHYTKQQQGLSAFVGRSRLWEGVAPLEELCSWDLMVERLGEAKRLEIPGASGPPKCHVLSHGCRAVDDMGLF